MDKINNSESIHILWLDSVRGMLALFVAFGHTLGTLIPRDLSLALHNASSLEHFTLLFLTYLFHGQTAVMIFFIISGFVLKKLLNNLQYKSQKFVPVYKQFIVKRIFRIMPAHLAVLSIVVTLILLKNYINLEFYTYTYFVNQSLTDNKLYEIYRNIILFDYKINPVTWSIHVELYCALLLPLLWLISRRNNFLLDLIVIYIFYLNTINHYITYKYIYYLLPFYFGMVIDTRGKALINKLKELKFKHFFLLLFLSYILMFFSQSVIDERHVDYYIFEYIGGFTILSILLYSKNTMILKLIRLLEKESLVNFGKRSYSFYLIHFPVMTMICFIPINDFYYEHFFILFILLFTLSFFITNIISMFVYNCVEKKYRI